MSITNWELIGIYECTYSCDEDRHTECQYYGNICEQCIYFKKKQIKKECPLFKDECINPSVPCDECFVLNIQDNDYLDDEDIEIDDEDIITFINFDIEDLPF